MPRLASCPSGEPAGLPCARERSSENDSKAQRLFTVGLLGLVLTILTGPVAIVGAIPGLCVIYRGSGHRWKGRVGVGIGAVATVLGIWPLLLAMESVQEAADRAT
jgi:hypothetical protein